MSAGAAPLTPVTVGFVPLVDAALLVAAREEGFAAARGLDLRLVREGSWAAVRDKLNVGLFDAAHMLGPAAIASTLGLGHVESRLASPMALNRDGNAITLSLALADRMKAAHPAGAAAPTPVETASILARLVAERRSAGLKPITAGVVFGFSNHVLQVSAWLRLGGLEPEQDVPLVVIPPPLMVESLLAGHIDLFCAGAPWNAMADAAGAGRLLHPCAEILPGLVEKLLVVRAAQADASWLPALTRALLDAAAWCHDPGNRPLLARHLARPDYVGAPVALIERILAGQVPTVFGGSTRPWISVDPAVLAPDEATLRVVFDQMALSRQLVDSPAAWAQTRMILLPDIHAAATSLPDL